MIQLKIQTSIMSNRDMKNDEKNFIIGLVFTIVLTFLFAVGVLFWNSAKELDQLRATNDRLTERVIDAENTNRRLAETITDCRGICVNLGESIDRNIGTVSDAIEIIEETREAVGALEVALGLWDSDGYYDWLDSYLQLDEISEEKE